MMKTEKLREQILRYPRNLHSITEQKNFIVHKKSQEKSVGESSRIQKYIKKTKYKMEEFAKGMLSRRRRKVVKNCVQQKRKIIKR